jgi:hypothetical protein
VKVLGCIIFMKLLMAFLYDATIEFENTSS